MKRTINSEHVRLAAKSTKIVLINKQSIITPLAQDMAKELGVTFQYDLSRPLPVKKEKDVFPVKSIAIASDHGGFEAKSMLIPFLEKAGYAVVDFGPNTDKACDYPDYAFKVAHAVSKGRVDRGVMIDSVGIGSAMAANRVEGVLAAKCNNVFEAHSAREHNYANVLTLGAKIVGSEMLKAIVKEFMETPGGAERHLNRVNKILEKD